MIFDSSLFWCQQGYDFSPAGTSEIMLLPFLHVLAYEASGFWQLVSTREEEERCLMGWRCWAPKRQTN